jgi:hypothetical protein
VGNNTYGQCIVLPSSIESAHHPTTAAIVHEYTFFFNALALVIILLFYYCSFWFCHFIGSCYLPSEMLNGQDS